MKAQEELQKLINHPTYKLLETEAQHFEYILKQSDDCPYDFLIGNSEVYSIIDFFSGTAEDFLEKVMIPRFAEFATGRIAQKRIQDSFDTQVYYDLFRTQYYDKLADITANDHIMVRRKDRHDGFYDDMPVAVYEDPDTYAILWNAYAILECFAIKLKSVRFIRTHCNESLAFEIFVTDRQPHTFEVANSQNLRDCFILLSFLYFEELIKNGQTQMAHEVFGDTLTKYLTETSGIAIQFDFVKSCALCLMTGATGFLFKHYDFEAGDFEMLIHDINSFRFHNRDDLPKENTCKRYCTSSNNQRTIVNTLGEKAEDLFSNFVKLKEDITEPQ